MVHFYLHSDSEIPASRQLFDQIRFAIASRQYAPGDRLPSTRQLAIQTGLHRNTISKVYQQLEDLGLVVSQAGSGMYVRPQGNQITSQLQSPIATQYPQAHQTVHACIEDLITQGCSLAQAKELFLAEIDWRLRCSAKVVVTTPDRDLGAGELIVQELEQYLGIPLELYTLENLATKLAEDDSVTVVTSRYFLPEAEAIASQFSVRAIPVDIHDFAQELDIIKNLPNGSSLGVVSLSPGILKVVEVIVNSLRGEEIYSISCLVSDTQKLRATICSAHTIISDSASYRAVKAAIFQLREELIRIPKLIESQNYIGTNSINLLKRELGIS
jgi:GntR family transcriptional regulator